MCDCSKMHFCDPETWGIHHHMSCPLYKTEKHPYLFYYEDGVDRWVLVPKRVDGELICTADDLDDDEEIELRFKRVDMTDAEFDALPEE